MEQSIFSNCKTLAEARKQWLILAKQHHPDIAPQDAEIMRDLNEAYQVRVSELSTISVTVHKYNLPCGKIITMNPLKGRDIWFALRTLMEDSDLGVCMLLERTILIDGQQYKAEYYRSTLNFADTRIIINEFFKHNFKK